MEDADRKAQGYAMAMEHIIKEALDFEKFSFSGIVNSDFIRWYPLPAVAAVCGFLYSGADVSRRMQIEMFLGEAIYYLNMPLDELLSFEGSSKIIDGIHFNLGYKNGEAALSDITEKFERLCYA